MIRVALADDHPVVRGGIRKILERSPDIWVVGEASNGKEALDLVERYNPDFLVLDLNMPVMDGFGVTRALKSKGSDTRILVLSAYDDSEFIRQVMACGVDGYINKDDVPLSLVLAIHKIAVNGPGDRGHEFS